MAAARPPSFHAVAHAAEAAAGAERQAAEGEEALTHRPRPFETADQTGFRSKGWPASIRAPSLTLSQNSK